MELLAPAGNIEKLKTVILYGADAVYLAGQKFGLRGASDNFSYSELKEGIAFAREKNCKAYVTINSFLHDNDLEELRDYVKILENYGIDAVIVSDLGAMTVIQQSTELPIHLSTQASCLNIFAAKLWKNLGVKRLILGREVSLEEASKIKNEVDIELELFIHGSMCMSYSGNCIISNYTAGRDSNRGGCIQSCRFSYSAVPAKSELIDSRHKKTAESLISSKDLRGIELLPSFFNSGVDSIKVEGRMKSSLYAATTTSAYSRAIKLCKSNSNLEIDEKLKKLSLMLEKIPHRGYTEGYLLKHHDENSIYNGDRNSRNSVYEFAGTVMEVEVGKSLIILTQNSIDNSCILEILSFNGEVIEISTKEMETISKNPVSKSKPNHLIRIPYSSLVSNKNLENDMPIKPLNVVRIKSRI